MPTLVTSALSAFIMITANFTGIVEIKNGDNGKQNVFVTPYRTACVPLHDYSILTLDGADATYTLSALGKDSARYFEADMYEASFYDEYDQWKTEKRDGLLLTMTSNKDILLNPPRYTVTFPNGDMRALVEIRSFDQSYWMRREFTRNRMAERLKGMRNIGPMSYNDKKSGDEYRFSVQELSVTATN